MSTTVDNLVIGGGIYGLHVATKLAQEAEGETFLLERESAFFTRASSKNHGRLHHGYQYALSDGTASECKANYQRFRDKYRDCIEDTQAYYAVLEDSVVSPTEYELFCERVGLDFRLADPDGKDLQATSKVKSLYEVDETVFSIDSLRSQIVFEFNESKAVPAFETEAVKLEELDSGGIAVETQDEVYFARNVYNCSYAGTNWLHMQSGLPLMPLKDNETILFRVELPITLRNISFTAIYGSFTTAVVNNSPGSTHVLAHVAHSKRVHDTLERTRPAVGDEEVQTRFKRLLEDGSKYFAVIADAQLNGFTCETVSFSDGIGGAGDRRVLVVPNYANFMGYHVIIGGKMNNFFDAGQKAVQLSRIQSK